MPSQPTGVRIDSSKLAHIHTELVRLTDTWPVEKIERVNTILAKVIVRFSAVLRNHAFLGLVSGLLKPLAEFGSGSGSG